MQTWETFYRDADRHEDLSEKVFRCPMCRTSTVGLLERGERDKENMPFEVDGWTNRLMDWVREEAKRASGTVEEGKKRRTDRHSVEAMRRFEDFWVKWDSDNILDELEREVEVIEIMSD